MKLLILSGTGWLGTHLARAALDAGHQVTCLSRGNTQPTDGAILVRADRSGADALADVRDEHWNAVVDLSSEPGQARRGALELSSDHWVYVSSGNAYADHESLRRDESTPTLTPLAADAMESMEQYGEAKVACENAYRAAPGTSTVARAGLIGGPGDQSGRSGYWPWRFAHPSGENVLVPDDPDFPVAIIDVRDLATWLLHAAQQRLDGVFNTAGAVTTLAQALELSAEAAGSTLPLKPIPVARLAELGLNDWMGPRSLPLFIRDPDWRGFASLNTDKALGAGLQRRPLRETLAAALEFENRRTTPRLAGLTDQEEQEARRALCE